MIFTEVSLTFVALHHNNWQTFSSTGDRSAHRDKSNCGNQIVSVGTWKQMRDKFHSLHIELSKWLGIRDQLGSVINKLVLNIGRVHTLWTGDSDLEE